MPSAAATAATAAAAAAADPMQGKILLALVSALIGWAIKTVWDEFRQRQRFRRLSPMVLRQLRSAATSFSSAMDTLGIPRAVAKLTAAQTTAIELVGAGVSADAWLNGLTLIADCLDCAQEAQTVPLEERQNALQALREAGDALAAWSKRMLG